MTEPKTPEDKQPAATLKVVRPYDQEIDGGIEQVKPLRVAIFESYPPPRKTDAF